MVSRWTRIIGAGLLAVALWVNPAYAQRSKKPVVEEPSGTGAPVGQYALVVILLAIPIGLICRSSRR